MKSVQLLFIRFLKVNHIYYVWFYLVLHRLGDYKEFIKWFNRCSSVDYILRGFSWIAHSDEFPIAWNNYHNEWLDFLHSKPIL